MSLIDWYADWLVVLLTRATVKIVETRRLLGDSPLDEEGP